MAHGKVNEYPTSKKVHKFNLTYIIPHLNNYRNSKENEKLELLKSAKCEKHNAMTRF